MLSPRSILVLKPSSLGDIVHTLPAVAQLKRHWPDAHLRWLINSEWAPLLDGNPHVDELLIFPRREFRGLTGWTKIPAWANSIRSQKADLVLDFQGLLRSALIARLCRGDEVIGLSDAREGARFFYDRTVDVRGLAHAVDRYLALAAEAAGERRPETGARLEWPLPKGSQPIGFESAEPFVLLHPFSRGAGKSLPVTEVQAFCRAMAPTRVVLAGRTEERVPPLPHVTDLLNRTTLHELIWLLRRAAFVVSVDSGPMHIAAALTPRLLSIHTWSDPRKVGPYPPGAWIWKDRALFQMGPTAAENWRLSADTPVELAAFVARLLEQPAADSHRE